jgi:hypothetical protein
VDEFTYDGMLDDFSTRNGIFPEPEPYAFYDDLTLRVFVGAPVAINDGYLLQQVAGRVGIMHHEDWPLTELARVGFVKIVIRDKDCRLERVPEAMATNGIESFQNMVAGPHFQYFRDQVEAWTNNLHGNGRAFLRWPPRDTSESLFKLLKWSKAAFDNEPRLLPVRRAAFDRFFDRFASGSQRRRNEWESVALVLKQKGDLEPDEHRALLRLVNAAYHYNWGICLGAHNAERVRVRTEECSIFAPFHDSAAEADPVVPSSGLEVPDVTARTFREFVRQDWGTLGAFVTDPKMLGFKRRYLAAMKDAMTTPPELSDREREKRRNDADAATQDYSLELWRYFGEGHVKRRVSWGFRGLRGAATVASFFVPHTAAAHAAMGMLKMGISVGGKLVSSYPMPATVARALMNPKVRLDQPGEAALDSNIADLALSPASILAHVEGVKLFGDS